MRLAATLGLDMKLQARNQLYAIGVGLGVFFGGACRFLVPDEAMARALPALLLLHMGSTTVLFVAALVIFEKAQGTLRVQLTSPLERREYLASKCLTLGGFAAFEGALLILISQGIPDHFGWYLVGSLFLGWLYTLLGFILVARHDAITNFLVPDATLVGTLMPIGALPYFGIWESPLWYLWPLQPSLVLFEAAFNPVPPWKFIYAFAYSALLLWLAWHFAGRAYERWIRGSAA